MAAASNNVHQSSLEPLSSKSELTDAEHNPRFSRSIQEKVKIVELFTLHVLPRNGEWQYAKDFITMADVLDEELKEDMLLALRTMELEESKRLDPPHNDIFLGGKSWTQETFPFTQVESNQRDDLLIPSEQDRTLRDYGSGQHVNSEKDFGIDDSVQGSGPRITKKSLVQKGIKPETQPNVSPRAARPPSKPKRSKPPMGVQKKSFALVKIFYRLLAAITQSLRNHPAAIMRLVLLCTAVILTLRQNSVRAQFGRVTGAGWDRLKKTVGMGVKISYI